MSICLHACMVRLLCICMASYPCSIICIVIVPIIIRSLYNNNNPFLLNHYMYSWYLSPNILESWLN